MDDELQQDQQAEEALLERLRAAASRVDPVPEEARLAARSTLAYLRLDAELAELVFDSVDEEKELAGVRSAMVSARQLSFHAGALEIELEIVADGDRRRLVGQCLPATTVTVTVRRQEPSPAGTPGMAAEVTEIEAPTDELGRFTTEVAAGRISLRCVWPGTGTATETSWVDI